MKKGWSPHHKSINRHTKGGPHLKSNNLHTKGGQTLKASIYSVKGGGGGHTLKGSVADSVPWPCKIPELRCHYWVNKFLILFYPAPKSPCSLLRPQSWRRPHGEGVGLWGWRKWNKNRNKIVFTSYVYFWPFFPTQNWLKNVTNDISIQEFHNVMVL